MASTIPLSLVLLGVSGYLIDGHLRAWRGQQEDASLSPRALRSARQQFLRRMQASSLIGCLGALVAIWPVIPRHPVWMGGYVLLLSVASLWIVLLALVDAWATSARMQDLRAQAAVRRAELLTSAAARRSAAGRLGPSASEDELNPDQN